MTKIAIMGSIHSDGLFILEKNGFNFFEINMFINLKAKVAPTPRQNFQKLQQRRKNSQHFPNK